ncbi:MAG TPA: response regulator transcription factor [Longimicrobiales bacterium]|nr:response regulator transcription factor [Longimicrobiales bacterium]
MIRTIAIEDDPRYRSSLEMLLRSSTDFELVHAFEDAEHALACLEGAPPPPEASGWDLVIMDLDLPGLGGVECTRRIKALAPATTIVVLTVFEERTAVLDAICAGADGYLLKRTPGEELLSQLRAVNAGGSPLSAGVARTVLDLVRRLDTVRPPDTARSDLSERELDVLRCLVQGHSYKQVASRLGISIHTVRNHIRSIYGKLRVRNVAGAVSRALREGLV